MGFLRNSFLSSIVAVIAIYFYPGLEPHIDFTAFELAPTKPLEGKLSLNEKLNNAEKLFENEIHGPECLVTYKNELYTGVHGGHIVKVTNGKLVPVAKLGKTCFGFHQEDKCGRPLGMTFDKTGTLYVADAYYGIFKLNVSTGQSELIVSIDSEIEGIKPRVPNSVVIASDGSLYWTDSSTNYKLNDGVFDLLTSGSGRLIKTNPRTKTSQVLLSKLHFPNGIEISNDESFLIFAESMRNRIHRYNLRGPKQGKSEIFIDGLPGVPDNLKKDSKGNFLVSLISPAGDDIPNLLQITAPFPSIRKFLVKVLHILEKIPSETVRHMVGHFESVTFILGDRYSLLFINHQGEIVDSLHSLDGSLKGTSDVAEYQGAYYFGSPYYKFIGRIANKK